MTGPGDLYHYAARLIPWDGEGTTGWHDGDSCQVDVDLGCHVHWQGHLRVAGYNAPEVYGDQKAAGEAAAGYVRGLVDAPATIWLDSVAFEHGNEEDDFGRMLAYITLPDGRDLAPVMIAAGQAVADPPK